MSVLLQEVGAAAQFAVRMRSGHTQISPNYTPTHASPSHSLHSCFLSDNLFSGGSENVLAKEHFPIPSELRKGCQDYFNQLKL